MNFISKISIVFFLFSASSVIAAPTVYIPLGSGNMVIAVDAAKDKIVATYDGVSNPHGLVATPDGEYLIVGSLKETPLKPDEPKDTLNSKLSLIHPAHGHVMSTIAVSGWTHHQAISPDGRYVISTHAMRGKISVADMKSNKIINTIDTGLTPNYTLITKDGKYAYISNTGNNTISELDMKTWKVIRNMEAGAAPAHMVFSPDESRIYVSNPRAGEVSLLDIKSGKIIKNYSIGESVHGLDIGDDGKTLFISSKKGNFLVALDTSNGSKRTLKLSPQPYHLNTIPGTGKVYVSSREKPIIWVIDQNTMKISGTIKLPAGEAHQMAIVN